jgi:hypothetical protein
VVIAVGVLAAFAIGHPAYAVSTVTVGSVDATAGQTDVVIPVCLTNDLNLRGTYLPLMIRKLGPAYVNKVKMGIGDRMVGKLNDIIFYKYYDTGESSNAQCKQYHPGGFPGAATFSVTSDTVTQVKQTVTQSPYGLQWARSRILDAGKDIVPGNDVTGSFTMTVDVTADEGCFAIDSTCMDPGAHLFLAKLDNTAAELTFTQGIVHVGACTGIVLDSPASVRDSVRGPQVATLTWDAVADADAYEVQVDETDNTFSNLTADAFVQGTSFAYNVADSQTVFWRVRAAPKNCDYCFGPWAGPQQYTDVQTLASSDIPDSYTLNQNYPNPFNASTVIEFTNKHDGHVTLQVYNILGQNVAILLDDFKPVGKYAITWNGTDSRGNVVPSGMYFYRVTTEDFTAVKKMTLLK